MKVEMARNVFCITEMLLHLKFSAEKDKIVQNLVVFKYMEYISNSWNKSKG